MLTSKSPSPANSNYDFALRYERVKLLAKVLKQFDGYVSRTTQAMREVASCLSLVGHSYHEVAQCVNNTNPHSTVKQSYISFNNLLRGNYGTDLQSAATLFSSEMNSIKNGEQYLLYNGSMHKAVLSRLQEVLKSAQKARDLGNEVKKAHKKAVASQKVVRKKESKYARMGRPLTESKLYVKQSEKMRRHDEAYEAKLRTFDVEFESLMQRQLYLAGHMMDDFLDVNTVYLSHMLKVLSCLAPHGVEAIEKMLDSGGKLGERLGVAPEDRLNSRLRTQTASMLNRCNVTPVRRGGGATPDKGTPAKSSRGGSSHNFTNYYENRRHSTLSAERAPLTARALDKDGDESNGYCCTLDGTPQRQLISNQTPLRAASGTTEMCRATGCAFSVGEPDSSPPLRAPSFPAAVRRGDATLVQYADRFAIGLPVSCRAPGTIADAGKEAKPIMRAAPVTVVATTDSCRGGAHDATTARATRELRPSHASCGGGSTPTVALPAPHLALAPPSQCLKERPSGRSSGCSAVLASQAAKYELNQPRPTEPFGDDSVTSAFKQTPRLPLEPISLSPLDVDESYVSQQTIPRMSTASTVVADAVIQQHTHCDKKKRKTTGISAATGGGVPELCTASAPPDEDTVSSRTDMQSQEASVSSMDDCYATRGHHPPPQQQRDVKQRSQRDTAPANLALFPAVGPTGDSGTATYQCCGDGLYSEGGGVSASSHNFSGSCGLDSPAPTPQPRALGTDAWEDSQVQPCSPA
ncbi:hypothetical protein Q4I30_004100 [Leishmania utingensis]|uniref:BAR domain-containing protein n=1 Tax=Leishmania utingensis TaxID=653362 RepID=A0AAW3AJ41_9TRYP